jgi:hypothetical protein
MTLLLSDLATLRADAVIAHRGWKRRSFTFDTIAADEWQTVWDDLTVESGEPLVENVLLQALEDKVASAGSIEPRIYVHPTRGTRADRAERVAEQRKRVFQSYWDRSDIEFLRFQLFMDWYGHGAAYLVPWCDLYDETGRLVPPAERFPYLLRANPRHVFPLSHNHTGRLTSVLISKLRRIEDIRLEYGESHPGVLAVTERFARESPGTRLRHVEETWYFDETTAAIALTARPIPTRWDAFRYVSPIDQQFTNAGRFDEWLAPPAPHGLDWCPVAERKRVTNDGEYRSPLDVVIPRLKVAQNFMARLLEDVADSVFGPVLMEGIVNPEDFGPNAELIGDGQGRARIEYPRKPINFEARQVILDQVSMARRDAKHPEQRSGEAGVSIGTAKHTESLMGAFNEELKQAHKDVSSLFQWANSLCANYDEVHCAGRKRIDGIDSSGAWLETYDPTILFKKDYRNKVSYGAAAGLDRHNLMTMMSLGRNMKAISQRTFMRETGLVDDPLQEERDILLEDLIVAIQGTLIEQAVGAGNMEPLRLLFDKIDGDAVTVRQAVTETVREMHAVATEGPAAGGPGGVEADPLRMVNSLEAGGSGTQGGLTDIGRSLRGVLPSGVNRALAG